VRRTWQLAIAIVASRPSFALTSKAPLAADPRDFSLVTARTVFVITFMSPRNRRQLAGGYPCQDILSPATP